MIMKQLFRYTFSLFRIVLLLGAMVLMNTQKVQAQTAEELAAMPNAFETMNPEDIIGDKKYYYIQFYGNNPKTDFCSYLTDCGVEMKAKTKDFLPSGNRQWTLEDARDGNTAHFKLKSKEGHYLALVGGLEGLATSKYRLGCVGRSENATIMTCQKVGDDYFLFDASDDQLFYRSSHIEWETDFAKANSSSGTRPYGRMRFAKLKDDAAFIIYYRGEGINNSNPSVATTRHYLTYSGTDDALIGTSNFWSSDVSSQQSVIPSDMALYNLPTLAAYHKDGLWKVEDAGNGDFYIRRYDNEKYLNKEDHGGNYSCALEDNPADKYSLEDPTANRYSRIQNVVQQTDNLANEMFYQWDGWWQGANKGNQANWLGWNVNQTLPDGNNNTVVGDGNVSPWIYADLSDYEKMTINGDVGLQLRVLMSRQTDNNGPMVEKNVTIGSDGKAEVDLKNLVLNWDNNHYLGTQTTSATVKMTHIDGSDGSNNTQDNRNVNTWGEETSATGGYNNGYNNNTDYSISTVDIPAPSWGVNNIIYLQVDASAIYGTITKVTLNANATSSTDRKRDTGWGAGYTDMEWSSTMTWNSVTRAGGRNITDLTPTAADRATITDPDGNNTNQMGYGTISLDITGAFTNDADQIATIVVYETRAAGGTFSNPTVTVEYIPNKVSYAHLNAIKLADNSPSGQVNSITLTKSTNDYRYLHRAHGDGWQVLQWPEDANQTNDYFYAGFYPVGVPDPNEDEYYGVLAGVKRDYNQHPRRSTGTIDVNHRESGSSGSVTYQSYGQYGGTFTVNTPGTPTNVFQYSNLYKGCYDGICIEFGNNPPPTGYFIHTYGDRFDYQSLESLLQHEDGRGYWVDISLTDPIIDDFTIFTLGTGLVDPITITHCFFYIGDREWNQQEADCGINEMLNYDGKTSTYSEEESKRLLWYLEQTDDYAHFRLKSLNGRYYKADGQMTTNVNEAHVFTNEELLEKFQLKWYFITAEKEIDMTSYYVTHRESYLKQYAQDFVNQETDIDKQLEKHYELERQGLATEAQSDWWNYDGNGKDGLGTQKVNHFEITHYLKLGQTITVDFPTTLRDHSDHVYFQRFYKYGESDLNMDLDNLKAHVSLDVGNDDVQYFLYKNGMVTGRKLDWSEVPQGGYKRNVQNQMRLTNSDGQEFTAAVDVSRYSDMTYANTNSHLEGDLEEPSLTMRYLYNIYDAKDMADKLTLLTEQPQSDVDDKKWYESKVFHFPSKPLKYENDKMEGYRGEFIPVRYLFSDYWIYKSSTHDDANLVSLGENEGYIDVEIYDPNGTGITEGGWNPTIFNTPIKDQNDVVIENNGLKRIDLSDVQNYKNDYRGYYYYDKMYNKSQYGNSRFLSFRYPTDENGNPKEVTNNGESKPVYLRAYFNYNGTRYQIAQFTIIFVPNCATLPWTSVNSSDKVKDTDRDPKNLRNQAGHPIAKVTFDYPTGETYHYPASDANGPGTRHNQNDDQYGTINNSSPLPLIFDKTNYAFDGESNNWGSYAMISSMSTQYGNDVPTYPANHSSHGYDVAVDQNMKDGFLYIDASEQPGDICAMHFEGEFCPSDLLLCTGWISGSNVADGSNDIRCGGGITLTMKGEDENGKTQTIYRFCPGQIYELDNGNSGFDGRNGANAVVWQQFYFKFSTDKKYKRYWMEVNNNCVSSNGGDFMLDNIEVYAYVPEVDPDINTPLCVKLDEQGEPVTEMRLLKLKINYNKMKTSRILETTGDHIGTAAEGFAFLEKYKFLEVFRTGLKGLSVQQIEEQKLQDFNFNTISLDELALAIEKGQLAHISTDEGSPYKTAFDAAILGNRTTWRSDYPEQNMNASIMYFRWWVPDADLGLDPMPTYSFYDAVNKRYAVFVENIGGEDYLVINGNFPQLQWKFNTDYYVINTGAPFISGTPDNPSNPCGIFNLCSECCLSTVFQIEPPYELLGLEKSEGTNDYVVCEGQIPTIVLNLKGFDFDGNEVNMSNINYDWWLGDPNYTETDDDDNVIRPKLATLENYHKQHKVITYKDATGTTQTEDVRLDKALSALRSHYSVATSLDERIIVPQSSEPALTLGMIKYLKELVDAGELVLHQTSVSVPSEPISGDDPYFYLVACPIHDEMFDQALNPAANEYVSYFCDEPQGFRIKVGEKAPTLKTGFVPEENGFNEYHYPTDNDPVLSIRLAKAAQFETVKHDKASEAPKMPSETSAETTHYLWLPIRDAKTQTAGGVIRKTNDYNVYLASSNDPTWDKKISKSMSKYSSLPIVGKIVQLYAKNTKGANATETATLIAAQNAVNRLCIYFVEEFDVREGYNYTLSLPFEEDGEVNACNGTMLINLKIVPDYEVWTGSAGNTDWNNDENWRRADGNTTLTTDVNGDELYRADGAVDNVDSPLHNYTTNKVNYYNTDKENKKNKSSIDQILRKGFAPLYCTHILMKSDEWGDAPQLYDAFDGKDVDAQTGSRLTNSPFPNLRDYDGWDGSTEESPNGITPATATSILRYDMQARLYDIWPESYGENVYPNKGRSGDLVAEMYQINSCDEIAFQPSTELLNAHLLNYNTAWVEYQLNNKRWYLLGSPLQGTIAGEWYAPSLTSQQKTTYYDPVTFNKTKYDRYAPAIYQRSWDQAKAVLYEVGSTYSTSDDSQQNLGYSWEGSWNSGTWTDPTGETNGSGADEYLDRLGYKPMGGNKANVAIQGVWSNTYNDATVDYTKGGFSVMVMNHLKPDETTGKPDRSDGKSIIRLPKEDEAYLYWTFDQNVSGTNTNVTNGTDYLQDTEGKNRAQNRGRLKTDLLLPESSRKVENTVQRFENANLTNDHKLRYGTTRSITRVPIKETELQIMLTNIRSHEETVSAGVSNLGFYLVENPFPCGLDMEAFFAGNTGLEKKYWLLTDGGQQLVQWATTGWVSPDVPVYPNNDSNEEPTGHNFAIAKGVVAPGQGFFVQATTPGQSTSINFTKVMQAQTRYGVESGSQDFNIVVGYEQETEEQVIDIDLDGDGVLGETLTIDGEEVKEQETVKVLVYETDPDTGDLLLDDEGNKIPKLNAIYQDVTIYSYGQTGNTDYLYPLLARTRGEGFPSSEEGSRMVESLPGLVITAERDKDQSSALVMQREQASNDFLPSEDTETFITSDLEHVPTVYTLCGRLATTINSIHDFRSLPIGVESNSDAPCTLTFKGVEMLGDSIAFYDALEQKLTPLKSGMTVSVSGQTQNRYYLVRSLFKEEAAAETHLQIFTEGLTAKVIASTAEPITSVRCYDTAGRLIHSASPQTPEYSFTLPIAGIYIICAETENDRKTIKLMAK